MSLVRWSIENSRLGHVVFLLVIVSGIYAFYQLPVEVYPPASLDRVTVLTFWPGASAEEVEQQITNRIEAAISEISGVSEFKSESAPSVSVIRIELADENGSVGQSRLLRQIEQRVAAIKDLPEGAGTIKVRRQAMDENIPLLRICLVDDGHGSDVALYHALVQMRSELRQLPGISMVSISGTDQPQCHVILNNAKLHYYGLTPLEVGKILQASNQISPASPVKSNDTEFALAIDGHISSLKELGEIIIKKDPAGAHVPLNEVATIKEVLGNRISLARFRGDRCMVLSVGKKRGANVKLVSDSVEEFVNEFNSRNSDNQMSAHIVTNLKPWVDDALGVMRENLTAGLVLVALTLWMLLGFRNSLLAIVGIPFSLSGTLFCIYLMGYSINTATVFAMVLVAGLIVDDAIVVLENIHRNTLNNEQSRLASIVKGVSEVIGPIIAAALTTLVAFIPILMIPGWIGKFFAVVPPIVGLALIASLIECLVILPGHFLHWGSNSAEPPGRFGSSESPKHEYANHWDVRIYIALLQSFLRVRYLVLICVASLIGLSAMWFGRLPVKLLPTDFPMAHVNFDLNAQASLEKTDQIASDISASIERAVSESNLAEYIISVAGFQQRSVGGMRRQSNVGQIWVQLRPTQQTRRNPELALDQLRSAFKDYLESHPDSGIESWNVMPSGLPLPSVSPVSLRIQHHQLEVCKRVTQRIENRLAATRGVFEIEDNLQTGPFQVRLQPKEPEASEFGLTVEHLGLALGAATGGVPVGNMFSEETGDRLPLRLRTENQLPGLSGLLKTKIDSTTGARPELSQVVDVEYVQDFSLRYHHNGNRAVEITASLNDSLAEQDSTATIQDINQMLAVELEQIKKSYPEIKYEIGGQLRQQQISNQKLFTATCVAGLLIYLILVVQFKDYLKPFLALATLSFAGGGIVVALLMHGFHVTVVTGVVAVGLFGVSVNDSILLIDFIRRHQNEGHHPVNSTIAGSRRRFRPIVITTITTVVGMAPLATGIFGYSTVWSPFAACFCYGLTAATLLTLFATPCFYLILEDAVAVKNKLLGSQRTGAQPDD